MTPHGTGALESRKVLCAGLGVSLALPLGYHLAIDPMVIEPALNLEVRALFGYAVMWALAAAAIAMTLAIEHRPLSSIGLAALPGRQILLAAGAGLLLSMLVPVLSFGAHAIVGSSGTMLMDTAADISITVLILGVLTAAVTEEVLFRGYAIERLLEVTGQRWLAGAISLAVFTAIHVPNWGVAHSIGVVLPLGVALTVLYLWKRNVLLVIIVHFIIDAPLIVLALIS